MTTPQRFVIVGTAPSWVMTPWTDQTVVIASLNDAYRMKGFQRADRWYDTHPLDKLFVPPEGRPLMAHQVPPGYYVRPAGHLEWLSQQSIPIVLHPDYRTQHAPAATWAHAQPLPWADIEAHFGRYFTSSPALIMAHALLEGYRDFAVYGIHLATEGEYIDQRPQFEFLIGRALGPGKLQITVRDGLRHYTTPDAHVALPEQSPVLQSDHLYSFETKPRAYAEPLKWDLHRFGVKQARAMKQGLAAWTPWARRQAQAEAAKWAAYQADTHERLQRLELQQKMG